MGPPSTKERVGKLDEVESRIKAKNKDMVEKHLYLDIVIGEKTWGAIMSEMVIYSVSKKVSVTNDRK